MIPPIEYNYHRLPYNELPPEIFEKLCLSFLTAKYGQDKCSFYGLHGQNQYGFDIYVRDGGLYDLYQCKRVLKFNSSNLKDAIAIWENGIWASRTRKFIIISSNSLEDTSFLEEFERQKQRLFIKGIVLEKIGSSDLDKELKEQPRTVFDFFGIQWAKEFCFPEFSREFLQKQELDYVITKIQYPTVSYYIERKIYTPEKKKDIWDNKRLTLLAFIKAKVAELKPARVILKAEAAVGKSKELENVAHVFSTQDTGLIPVLIRLRNFQGGDLEKYIDNFFNSWNLIPPEKALFLFDGIDEVEASSLADFIKKFNVFLQSHPKSSIVASIRTNVFTKEIGSGIDEENRLNEMYLEGLNEWNVSEYLQKRLPTETQRRKFGQLTSHKWMKELFLNPFYLSAFTELFMENENSLPNTKPDVIRKLIYHKMAKDKDKYGSELPLDEIRKFAKVLALFLTLTGKNSLGQEEVKHLTSISIKDLRRFSLFKVEESIDGYLLYFEHNNFQEYIAASELMKLKWEQLKDILFHTKGTVILKPKMVNPASFLFSLLPTNSQSFGFLLDSIKNSQQSLLLNFEKDKLDNTSRLYVFKSIILKGKEEKIFFLRDDISALDLIQFTNYSIEALKFLLDELNAAEGSNYVYCILELIFFFPPEYSDGYLNKRLCKVLCNLIKTETFEYAVYDIAIDILAKFEFFSPSVLTSIKQCPLRDDKMVRSAIVKYVDKGRFKCEFNYVLHSAKILAKDGVHAALEDLYLRYILKYVDRSNILTVLSYFGENADEIDNFIEQSFYSENNRLINKIYDKVANMFVQPVDRELLNAAIDFIIKIDYRDHKSKEWGNPAKIFSKINEKQNFFLAIFSREEISALSFLLKEFYDPSFAPLLIEKYRGGSITKWQVLILRESLQCTFFHDELHSLLLNNFGDEFKYQEQVNWKAINSNRETRNISLMEDRDLFLSEAEKTFNILKKYGKGDTDATIELRYSEKKEILDKLDNTIILDVILDYEVKGGYGEFSKHFVDEKGWNWFIFQYVRQYIAWKKAHLLTKELLEAAQEYLKHKILPKVNFTKAITEKKTGSFSINNFALIVIDFFRNAPSLFSDEIVLNFLHMDFDGFYHYPDGEETSDKKRLFELIYARVGREKFVGKVLTNLKRENLPGIVKESHVFICRFYTITESLVVLKNMLTSRKTPQRTKEEIVATIIELTTHPEIFDTIISGWKTIKYEWQLLVCKHLRQFDCYQNTLISLIENSSLSPVLGDKESSWRFQLLILGLELGSFKVFYTMLRLFKIKRINQRFQIKSFTFDALINQNPLQVIEGSFEVLRILAPTFIEGRASSISEVLEEVIRNAVNDSEMLFELALRRYEEIIKDHIDVNPRVSYFKWFEKHLAKIYYSKASRFESDERTLDLINEIQLL